MMLMMMCRRKWRWEVWRLEIGLVVRGHVATTGPSVGGRGIPVMMVVVVMMGRGERGGASTASRAHGCDRSMTSQPVLKQRTKRWLF